MFLWTDLTVRESENAVTLHDMNVTLERMKGAQTLDEVYRKTILSLTRGASKSRDPELQVKILKPLVWRIYTVGIVRLTLLKEADPCISYDLALLETAKSLENTHPCAKFHRALPQESSPADPGFSSHSRGKNPSSIERNCHGRHGHRK